MDRIVRGISEHHGASKNLRKLYPEILGDDASALAVEKAVLGAFADEPGADPARPTDRERG